MRGHSLLPVLHDMQRRHRVERTVCVADRGMLSADNLDAMDAMGNGYVGRCAAAQAAGRAAEEGPRPGRLWPAGGIAEPPGRGMGAQGTAADRRLGAQSGARKDAHERRKAVERLLDKLARSSNPKEMLSNHGTKRFIAVAGDARLTVNPEKIAEAERWDGLTGVITNLRDAAAAEVLSHYHGLWQVEESFRITKHDLRVRPIWHWTPDRIRAHIAISFMAFACVRHLAYRVAVQKRRMSPRSHPLRARPPAVLDPALPAVRQPLRRPLEADARGGTNLRNHGAAPDHHPLPARLTPNEPRTGAEAPPDVVPSQK